MIELFLNQLNDFTSKAHTDEVSKALQYIYLLPSLNYYIQLYSNYLLIRPFLTTSTSLPPHLLLSLRELGLYQTEILLFILLSGLELVFGIVKIDTSVCQVSPDDLLPLSYWIIAKAILEINISTLLISFRSCQEFCNQCIIVSLWVLSVSYLTWNFVGMVLFCTECINDKDIGGTSFILLSLMAGVIFSYLNFKIIDFVNNIRYLPLNAPLIYNYYYSQV